MNETKRPAYSHDYSNVENFTPSTETMRMPGVPDEVIFAEEGINPGGKVTAQYEDFIGIYENVLPLERCQDFVNWFEFCVQNDIVHSSALDMGRRFRDDNAIFLPTDIGPDDIQHIQSQQNEMPQHALKPELLRDLWMAIDRCFFHYVREYGLDDMSLAPYYLKLHRVPEGGGYHVFHSERDSFGTQDRYLAFHLTLHNPEEGGETEFLFQKKRYPGFPGRMLIFPCQFTHRHRGNTVLKGCKYYATGWWHVCRVPGEMGIMDKVTQPPWPGNQGKNFGGGAAKYGE